MIEGPPLLTVRRNFRRPSKAKLKAFAGATTAMVVDAQAGRGALDHRVKPLDPASRFVGPAITAWCGPYDNLAALAALELARPGDVVAIAAAGFEGTAVIGDRFAGMAGNRRLGAIVTDGLVRERAGILEAGVPCYAMGLSANSPFANGCGEVGLVIVLGGVAVAAGDLLIGDEEGVVVVPRANIDEVLAALEGVKANEARLEREVREGATGFAFVKELLNSPATRYVD
ncbi:MAG: RraA family protein [Alphaproteobacteria bacterium]|jgi:4-hydroxy-4-methyl-2-oxoglutarate aldolase|nr:RraA family protein [Alphaproteobacteria bacterium]